MKRRTVARFAVLVVTSILGMAILGVAAFVVAASISDGWSPSRDWMALYVAAAVGAFVGFLSMPFVVTLLANAQLGKTIPRVYGISLIVTTVWAFLLPVIFGLSAAFPAFLSVVILSSWCGRYYPLPRPADRCGRCDYDLSGSVTPGCPECGWGRDDIAANHSQF